MNNNKCFWALNQHTGLANTHKKIEVAKKHKNQSQNSNIPKVMLYIKMIHIKQTEENVFR